MGNKSIPERKDGEATISKADSKKKGLSSSSSKLETSKKSILRSDSKRKVRFSLKILKIS